MYIVILDVFYVGSVPVMRKSGEPRPVKVCRQRCIAGNQAVNTHVKLFTPNEEGIDNVSLDDVRLRLGAFGLPPEIILPLRDLLELVEQENTLAL